MMRAPPIPQRRTDPTRPPSTPIHHSSPTPLIGPSSSTHRVPLSHPTNNMASFDPYPPSIISPRPRSNTSTLLPNPSQPNYEGRKETQESVVEEERAYESYGSTMYAQPIPVARQPSTSTQSLFQFDQSQSQPFSQIQSQSQSLVQPSNILVPETSHIPRRQPTVDFMGGFSPPGTLLHQHPPPRQHPRHRSESVIPETQYAPPKRVDTYRPQSAMGPPRLASNAWELDMRDGGVVPGRGVGTWGGQGPTQDQRQGRRSASVMPVSAATMAGSSGREAAEVFMSSTQQQGAVKTNSEKILEALTDWSTQIIELVDEVKKDQKQIRDQVHEVQTGQRALATREEVVEEITSQLSPALHEFFQTLHDKVDESVSPLPEETARLAVEKIREVMKENRDIKASQKSQEDPQEKPISKLIDHLISKLDSVSEISNFLTSYKDLPQTMLDINIFKQSLDSLTSKINDGPTSSSVVVQPPVDPALLQNVSFGINLLVQHVTELSKYAGLTVGGEERVIREIKTLTTCLGQVIQPPPPPPPTPAGLSVNDQQLRERVDKLSTGMDYVQATLAMILQKMAPPPLSPIPAQIAPPTLDLSEVADKIMAQVKADLALHFSSLQPIQPFQQPQDQPLQPHPQSPKQLQPLHPPQSLPPADIEIPDPASEYNFDDHDEENHPFLDMADSEAIDTSFHDSNPPVNEQNQVQTETQTQTQLDDDLIPGVNHGGGSSSATLCGQLRAQLSLGDIDDTTSNTIHAAPDISRLTPPTLPQSTISGVPSMMFTQGVFTTNGIPIPVPDLPSTSLALSASANEITLRTISSSSGLSALEVSQPLEEVHDGYDDIFDGNTNLPAGRRAIMALDGGKKGRGKRVRAMSSVAPPNQSGSDSTTTSVSGQPPKKKARTRTTAPAPPPPADFPLPSAAAPSSTTPKSGPKAKHRPGPKPKTPRSVTSNTNHSSLDQSQDGLDELNTPPDYMGITGTPSSYLKRSPRVEALHTMNDDTLYNSDKPSQSQIVRDSKAIKQEMIDNSASDLNGVGSTGRRLRSGAGASTENAITIDDSPPTPSVISANRTSDGRASRSRMYTPRSNRQPPPRGEVGDVGQGDKVYAQAAAGGQGSSGEDGEQTQAIFGRGRKDPPPLIVSQRYGPGRKRRIDDIILGDDSD